jgi:hypothetical protein
MDNVLIALFSVVGFTGTCAILATWYSLGAIDKLILRLRARRAGLIAYRAAIHEVMGSTNVLEWRRANDKQCERN